ncbi:MAG: UvrD-helicase domain-containing protein [Bacteroidaceae bacterium]|nr:UvrD-helicase domain-containing protein [Bacteroidaceae bacterium]
MKEHQALKIYRASAGSGKTFTLAVEYITLLMVNPLAYREILAVTFTNKATTEMKQRILGTLWAMGHGLKSADDYMDNVMANLERMKLVPRWMEEPYRSQLQTLNREILKQRARSALSNIIHDYSRFHIETIDSFFQSIVREIASELELPVNMKVELDEGKVLADAVDEIIDNLREGSSEFRSIIEFIEEKIKSNRSWQVDGTVKDFGRNIFKENYLIHGEEVRQRITNQSTIYQYRTIINKHLEEKKKEVTDLATQMLEAYKEYGMNEKDCTTAIVTFLEKVRDYRVTESTGTSKGTFSDKIEEHTENVDKWFKKSSKNRSVLELQVQQVLMPMLTKLFHLHDIYVGHLHTVNAIGQHLYSLMLLNAISEKVKDLNNENNRFLLSETANFLLGMIAQQDIPFIYEKTGTVIRHLMIDEFQDTSTLQWENFKPLILNSMATGGTCLIVGDVKQSIYRFRNSDWQILNNIERDHDLRGLIEEIPAQFNYRSSRRVVEFNNALFQNAVNLLQTHCPALTTAYGKVEQEVKQSEEQGYVSVTNLKDEADMMEHLQRSVKELMAQGVKASDITILVRYNREVPQICDFFNQHQNVLPVKVVSDEAFRLDASPAIHLLITALRAIASPQDKLPLYTLAHRHMLPTHFDTAKREQLRYKNLPELVEDLCQTFLLDKMEGQDAYLFYFNDLIGQYCEDNPTDLDSFLKAWDEGLCEKTIPNGASEGVRIMTIHKSKGLEFHTVIIPSCSWTIKPKDTEVMWCIPHEAPYNMMPLLPVSVGKAKDDSIFADDRRTEELRTLVDNINVLYVAFTRAKHNLIILTGNKNDQAPDAENTQTDSAQTILLRAMPPQMTPTEEENATIYQWGDIVASKDPENEKKTHALPQETNVLECDYAPQPVSFASHPSTAEFRQSYESEMFITEDSLDPKLQQHTERIRLISLGNLYHAIFQHIRTLHDVPRTVSLLQSRGCFGTLLEAHKAQAEVTRMIEEITPQHPEWFSAAWKVLSERDILSTQNNLLNSKRPDRVVVQGQRAIVIDYKTARGVVSRKADGTLMAPSTHRQQVQHYKNLLTQIGYTSVEAYLWYILDGLVVAV